MLSHVYEPKLTIRYTLMMTATDTGALQPRLYDTMAPAEYGSLLKKARAKRAALKQRVAEAQLVERSE